MIMLKLLLMYQNSILSLLVSINIIYQVENHHPECREQQELSVLDMYVDRVARGVEKSPGWSKEAWHIPKEYTPKEFQ